MKPVAPVPVAAAATASPSKPADSNASDTTASASAQKYLNITKPTDETGDAYTRESTVASVSGMFIDRSNSAASSLGNYSRQTSEVMKSHFE